MTPRIKWNTLVTLSTIAAVAGCTEQSQTSGDGEPSTEIVQRVNTYDLAFPLDTYRTSRQEEKILNQAIDFLTSKCMAKYGYKYSTSSHRGLDASTRRLYGVTDEREARRFGYRDPETSGTAERKPPPKMPEDEQAVLVGEVQEREGHSVPKGGCLGTASRSVLSHGPKGLNSRLPDELILEASEKAKNDSRVQAAFKEWSSCIKDEGFSFETPLDVLEGGRFQRESSPSDREINLAVADVRCKKKGNLVGIWSSIEMAYQRRAIDDHAPELEEIKEKLKQQISAANDIASRGGSSG